MFYPVIAAVVEAGVAVTVTGKKMEEAAQHSGWCLPEPPSPVNLSPPFTTCRTSSNAEAKPVPKIGLHVHSTFYFIILQVFFFFL